MPPECSGFHGFSITHAVHSPKEVDALLARAAESGGQIVTPTREVVRRGYFGYFADLDDNLWQVATCN